MPSYSSPHVLLRFGGSAASGQESWSCGVRLKANGPLSNAELLEFSQASVETMSEVVEGYFTSTEASFNPLCELDYVKLNPIGTDGKYLFPNDPVEFLFQTPAPVGAGSPAGPLQLAYCITLRGTYRRGPAAFGRWYVPVSLSGTTGTGVMSESGALTKANRAGTFLEDIQLIDIGDPARVFRVRLYGDGVGGPKESGVRLVQCGNVYDTQRRRREQIEETYFDATTWTNPNP